MATEEVRHRAALLTLNALKQGWLKKPTKCERCGNTVPGPKLHGHHRNYDKPSDITWLCIDCHGWTHRFLRWFNDRLQWLEYCTEKKIDFEEGLLPQLHKRTHLPLKTNRFEYWRVNLRGKWRRS